MKMYLEIEVDVEFDYTKAVVATMIDPPVFESLEITSVMFYGVELLAHITDDHLDQLTDAALDEARNPEPPEPDNYG